MIDVLRWEMISPREPLVATRRPLEPLARGEVLVRVAGCGVCHTDLGFFTGTVRPNHPLPLTLGHEVSGTVEAVGEGAEAWKGRAVIVPAILPCGRCRACLHGRYALCPSQIFPGNDVQGGFASHLVVPARCLCPVEGKSGPALALLAVVADAVSTPYEAIRRSGCGPGDLAIFVGAGGVGGFGVQIAAALGANVVVVEPSEGRRRLATEHGAQLALDPVGLDPSGIRAAIRDHAAQNSLPSEEWKIFETSGTSSGQVLAFHIMVRGSHLAVVGYTPERVSVCLSRLMALDARAEGNWGCAPERYPEVLALIEAGKVVLEPYVETHPLSQINAVLDDMIAHRLERRAVLIPDLS